MSHPGARGVDYGAPTGTPIKAHPGDGRIEFAGRKGGYGNAVIIDHGNGITTLYGHMSRFSAHRSQRSQGGARRSDRVRGRHRRGDRAAPALRIPRARGVHESRQGRVAAGELPPAYLAEFRAEADTLLAQMNLVARPA